MAISNEWYNLRSFLIQTHNPKVRGWFSDIIDDSLGNDDPRRQAQTACLITSSTSQAVASIKMQTFRDLVRQVGESAILASPDWWQVRIGGDRPQMVCTFRKGATRTYHSISIPHPANTARPTAPLIGEYTKGNYQGTLLLIDNSKVIVNCATAAEAIRVCEEAATLIDPTYLSTPLNISVTERRGSPVGVDMMYPSTVLYYPTGQRQTSPEYRVVVSQ